MWTMILSVFFLAWSLIASIHDVVMYPLKSRSGPSLSCWVIAFSTAVLGVVLCVAFCHSDVDRRSSMSGIVIQTGTLCVW